MVLTEAVEAGRIAMQQERLSNETTAYGEVQSHRL